MALLRWHHPSCLYPDVFFRDGIVHCRKCSSEHRLSEHPVHHGTEAYLAPPPDEPRGRMNLRWPSSVPYVRNGVRLLPEDLEAAQPQPSTPMTDDTVRKLIYKNRLAPDEFRLLHLLADGRRNGPIHVFLETYKQDNCPKYEATSYTWGGENGDYSTCWPVFVGAYWDVVFQTKNCYDMLRSLRLDTGTCTLWVDALCINQTDPVERSTQAASMRQIYSQSSCVAAYLQPVVPSNLNLETVFGRKYFSRVWTIQEMLLAPYIRMGDAQFAVDKESWLYFHVRGHFDRDMLMTPWSSYMFEKKLSFTDVYDMLCLMAQAQTSDPRDRLFGLFGLLPNDSILRPDYTLSSQHVFIGLFAHLIIDLGNVHLLFFAVGDASRPSFPSWMPDYTSHTLWQRMREDHTFPGEFGGFISTQLLKLPSKDDYTDKETPILSIFYPRMATNDQRQHLDKLVTVDADTAAFSMPLVHICLVPSQPRRVGQVGNLGVFEVRSSSAQNPFYLTAEASLDQIVRPESDHLFLWNHGIYTADQLYLLLREVDASSRTFRLVAACPHVFLSSRRANLTALELGGTRCVSIQGLTQSLHDALRLIRSRLHLDLETISEPGSPYESRFFAEDDAFILSGFLPTAKEQWDLFPFYRGIFNEQEGRSPGLEDVYRSYSSVMSPAHIADGFIEFSFAPRYWSADMEERYCYVTTYPEFENPWNWRTEGGEWIPMYEKKEDGQYEFLPILPVQQAVHVRAPLAAARAIFSKWMKEMMAVRRNLGCTLDELEQLFRDDLKEEQCLVRCPGVITDDMDYWDDVTRNMKLDGSTFRVNIV